jgi:glycosyltransferase involved in cell wall biosynthesis
MRVGFDLRVLQVNRGGTAVYTQNLFSALQELDGSNQYVPLTSKIRLPRRNLITKLGNAGLELLYTHILSPLRAAQLRVDLLHYPANTAPYLAPCPTVVTIYDMMFQRFPESYDPYYLRFARFFFPISARRADRILTISEFSKQDIVRYCGVSENKVKVIYPGVAADLAPVERNQAQAFVSDHYGIGKSPFVLFTGELGPRKNLENLIRAFSLLRRMDAASDFQLVLVGEKRDAQYFQRLITLIGNESLERAVHFLGFVPREDLKYILSAASAVAHISLCEGFGFPLVEAMACGTPLVTSNVSSMPEVAGDAGILVDPHNVEEIADGLQKILLDDPLREQLIVRGLQRATEFRWVDTARQTLSAYQELAQRK